MRWRWATGWLCVAWGVASAWGCVDEPKLGCQIHADCAGVRECVDGECVTPAEFAGEAFAPRYADEDAGMDEVDGGGEVVDGALLYLFSPDRTLEASLALQAWEVREAAALEGEERYVELLLVVGDGTLNRITFRAATEAGWSWVGGLVPGEVVRFEDVPGEGVVVRRAEAAP